MEDHLARFLQLFLYYLLIYDLAFDVKPEVFINCAWYELQQGPWDNRDALPWKRVSSKPRMEGGADVTGLFPRPETKS